MARRKIIEEKRIERPTPLVERDNRPLIAMILSIIAIILSIFALAQTSNNFLGTNVNVDEKINEEEVKDDLESMDLEQAAQEAKLRLEKVKEYLDAGDKEQAEAEVIKMREDLREFFGDPSKSEIIRGFDMLLQKLEREIREGSAEAQNTLSILLRSLEGRR